MTALGIVASAYVKPASVAATKWVNHVCIAAPRISGNTNHTVNPASDIVAAGTNFTPTAGRYLLVVVEGAVTSTTPAGWTLEASAVSGTGMYLWTRTAAGSDTLTTTHNAANYPVGFHWFEFNAGTTWQGDVTSTSVTQSGANPNLTGLTGTNLVMASKAQGDTSAGVTYSGTWAASTVEILDFNADRGTTDGYWLGIGYQESYATSSYQPTCTATGGGTYEAITWALKPT